ncbi:SDR family oxidoreductase [Acetilactobacillus jinshanensis]|uniref:SDR family oxidoreductase n=1 Tax=Acetilactobacillus jinshanensis TaxID=1720083 RepID=A0A4V1ALN2_9LACO|nr:SDR family oxidoreductase [Acetilactobacillus jinshanensis]QBP18189.1 SDR family oxidoreductase [Acetilactobacillus jinshanensis]URL61057.1 SDR family oxidoreductase [uncultured bacterium]
MKYAISAATGHLGRLAVQDLEKLVGKDNVVALARNVEKGKKVLPAGTTVRPGDYDDKAQLTKSLQSVDKLLMISSMPGGKVSRVQQHQNMIDAAKAAGVKYIAYTSFPHADQTKSAFAADHRQTEKNLKNSGLKYSFIRDNWYLRDDAMLIKAAAQGQPLMYSAGDGKVGWAPEFEYAMGAAKVLASDNPKPVYEFAGKSRSYADLAKVVAKVIGKPVKAMPVSDDQFKQVLKKAGMNDMIAGFVVSTQQLIRAGELTENSDDLEKVLGHPLMPLTEAIKKMLK